MIRKLIAGAVVVGVLAVGNVAWSQSQTVPVVPPPVVEKQTAPTNPAPRLTRLQKITQAEEKMVRKIKAELKKQKQTLRKAEKFLGDNAACAAGALLGVMFANMMDGLTGDPVSSPSMRVEQVGRRVVPPPVALPTKHGTEVRGERIPVEEEAKRRP